MKFIKKNWVIIAQVICASLAVGFGIAALYQNIKPESEFWMACRVTLFGVILGLFLGRLLDELDNSGKDSPIYDNSEMD